MCWIDPLEPHTDEIGHTSPTPMQSYTQRQKHAAEQQTAAVAWLLHCVAFINLI